MNITNKTFSFYGIVYYTYPMKLNFQFLSRGYVFYSLFQSFGLCWNNLAYSWFNDSMAILFILLSILRKIVLHYCCLSLRCSYFGFDSFGKIQSTRIQVNISSRLIIKTQCKNSGFFCHVTQTLRDTIFEDMFMNYLEALNFSFDELLLFSKT